MGGISENVGLQLNKIDFGTVLGTAPLMDTPFWYLLVASRFVMVCFVVEDPHYGPAESPHTHTLEMLWHTTNRQAGIAGSKTRKRFQGSRLPPQESIVISNAKWSCELMAWC